MKGNRRKIFFAWSAAIMWCALGLFLSSQDISGTTEISAAITRFTLKLFRLPGQTYYMYVFDGLRSAAHVGVFLVTSAAIWTAFFVSNNTLALSKTI